LQKPSKIILGIDPGTLIMGYCIIKVSGNAIEIIEIDVLKLSSKKDNYQRLQLIYKKLTELTEKYNPQECAIEAPFFGKNVQSMLKLGRAQGVAIAAVMAKDIPVTEYSPRKIKQSVTGNGNADKEQVWLMLQTITSLPNKPKYYDATDALAVAVCHHFQGKIPMTTPGKKSNAPSSKKNGAWEQFIQANSHRVKP
jgi:crossover junction endodeoxyribonuclease RuvC